MKIGVKLENCYGIRSLDTEFDFSKTKAYAIYAPNGAMKSSLAQTFQDAAAKIKSKDRIFPSRTTVRDIIQDGAPIEPSNILVIRPYDEVFAHSEKTSTLLVNATLRTEYANLHIEVEECKAKLIAALKTQASTKKDVEREISLTFTRSGNDFIRALTRIKAEIEEQKVAPFADVKYDIVFDERVATVLGTKDFKSAIKSYIRKYNELLDKSTYFKRGTFNYYNAANIAKSLADHGFFKASHTINLVGGGKREITDEKELESIIAAEKEGIASDSTLRKKFTDLEKSLEKNVFLREFQSYISDNDFILPELENVEKFKEDVWKSYIWSNLGLYEEFLAKVTSVEARRMEIEGQAAEERTQWEQVIEIFNERFFVPFKLNAKNRISVILGKDPILSLGFTVEEGGEVAEVERDELVKSLSTGEKKALYVLNVIFEIQARQLAGQKTLLIVDDVADSFDYRNKYAIIQYLKDISEENEFYELILTHNFDFFRTIHSRFVGYKNCLMASKSETGLSLTQAAGIQNVFVNDWKLAFFKDPRKRLASIPFIRNLIEFTKGETDPDYLKLTSLLHWKADSSSITQEELGRIYNSLFGTSKTLEQGTVLVIDLIRTEAEACLAAPAAINLENKIVLSIAVRLQAEKYMIAKINDPAFIQTIKANQTGALLKKFKTCGNVGNAERRVIERVALMTPENIHLNSFMYEPIIDMSDEHLRKLYNEVITLPP